MTVAIEEPERVVSGEQAQLVDSVLEKLSNARVSEAADSGQSVALRARQSPRGEVLSLMEPVFRGASGAVESARNALLAEVQRQGYSISDLFRELSAVGDAFEAAARGISTRTAERESAISQARARLRRVFVEVLERSTAVFEDAIERTRTAERELCEQLPIGVVKLGRDREFTFANRKAMEIFGAESFEGRSLEALHLDGDDLARVEEQLRRREQGFSDEYELDISRLDDGRKARISIAASPERDTAGHFVGSVAVFHDIELARVQQTLHQHIAAHRKHKDLFHAMAAELRRLVPFDMLTVAVNSQDMGHSRVIFTEPPELRHIWKTRWFPMTEWLRQLSESMDVWVVDDIDLLLQQPGAEDFRKDPSVVALLKEGMCSFASLPVVRGARRAAGVGLFSKTPGSFEGVDQVLREVPLTKAVLMGLYYREREKQDFRLELLREILRCRSLAEVATALVDGLMAQYKWQNIAIFWIDESAKRFILKVQRKGPDRGYMFPRGFTQPIREGMMGLVYREGRTFTSGNVREDPAVRDHYVPTNAMTISELCIPVKLGGQVRWILNVEDRMQNAFSVDEQTALEDLMDEVGSALDAMFERHTLRAVLENATDAVVVTDWKGKILEQNPTARDLLGCNYSIRRMNLKRFFEDPDIGKRIVRGGPTHGKFDLVDVEGQSFRAFVTSPELDDEFGRKVFFLYDLSLIERLNLLEEVEAVFREIALQMRTPLALAFAGLHDLKERSNTAEGKADVDLVLQQLRKVSLTYDRVALGREEIEGLPFRPIRMSVRSLVDLASSDLPQSERDKVDSVIADDLPRIPGDPYQLTFVLQTILSYLLRFVPVEGKVELSAREAGTGVTILISGLVPEVADDEESDLETAVLRQRAEIDISLGWEAVEKILGRHGGSLEQRMSAGQAEFELCLPSVSRRESCAS